MHDGDELYIDGRWQPAASGATREIRNPWDDSVLATVADGDCDDARAAIAAARRAFDDGDWPRLSVGKRVDALQALADAIDKQCDELATLETLNTGKTIEESRWDIADVAGVFRHCAQLAMQAKPDKPSPPNPHAVSRVLREPVGVTAQISPWNYPLLQASWKMAPALAAGCTMVLKPSELTPLSTLRLCELTADAGIPAGVVNAVPGPGATVGAELAESADVDLVSFTGGIVTGRRIMQAASGNVKRVALELGGKNPHIVFADAELDVALDYALNAVFFHAGQICSAGSRLLLERPIHDQFVDGLMKRMAAIRLGNGLDAATQMGPLISRAHRDKVAAAVDAAVAAGATLVTGGAIPDDPALANGYFYRPTLFANCAASMPIVQEEVFGPVITVEAFDSEDEALALANGTSSGLAAGFWTASAKRIQRLSRALRFGTVWVNDFNVYYAQAPWGGYKQSGIGRELGSQALEDYQELKHIYQNRAPAALHWFGNDGLVA